MAVLQGYKLGPIACGNCGIRSVCIEETDDKSVVLLRCWNGCTTTLSRQDPLVRLALGELGDDSATRQLIPCPAEGCPVSLPADDLRAQSVHMSCEHPEIIKARPQKANLAPAEALTTPS